MVPQVAFEIGPGETPTGEQHRIHVADVFDIGGTSIFDDRVWGELLFRGHVDHLKRHIYGGIGVCLYGEVFPMPVAEDASFDTLVCIVLNQLKHIRRVEGETLSIKHADDGFDGVGIDPSVLFLEIGFGPRVPVIDELIALRCAAVNETRGDAYTIGKESENLGVLGAPTFARALSHFGENPKWILPAEVVFRDATGIDQLHSHVVHDLFHSGKLSVGIGDMHLVAKDTIRFDERGLIDIARIIDPLANRVPFESSGGNIAFGEDQIRGEMQSSIQVGLPGYGGEFENDVPADPCRQRP